MDKGVKLYKEKVGLLMDVSGIKKIPQLAFEV